MSNSPSYSRSMPIDQPNLFPWKLYEMLDTAEKRNEEHIISWISDGKAFKVHNRDLFIEQYMKTMCNQTKFKSFQRQLNLWGFERVLNGSDKGSYFHASFVRGERDCCKRMRRVGLKRAIDNAALHELDKPELHYSPHSVATTAAESISTTGAAMPTPAIVASSMVGESNASTDSPAHSMGDFVDVARSTSTTAIESTFQRPSHQTQFSDFLHFHKSERRREMIRNTAIGLDPDLSLTRGDLPFFGTALSMHEEQQEQTRLSQQQQHQQQQQIQTQLDQQSQTECQEQQLNRRRISGLEALLSVSAQQRREEEMSLLLGLSNQGGISHSR
mmetsp:Transcript_28319/g.59578  ORF Transcript_28319/g.59578 Transcript_28319/m.59578 type:complete len:330 (-) Transcript_28319:245-1234(-)|eukprot:CAMPEP_0168248120 /NCGR_PEP_ID=MMETSP0141_2-20121125/1283_1 /TAXON_ID=44445 /ORGANISM="Pseudo-nitzschia australis, Strain 10249 10 AB" /LENGTH=329 /DNA_ID=CAMNT_0008183995 /DNA_START=212 /DNA_END=1201 /DNA_ORIENTATION=+